MRLKTKLKLQEADLLRKDKALEDFQQQSLFISNAEKKAQGSQLAPIVIQTQKYQQETFLLMSLKKQVRQLQADIKTKDELLSRCKPGRQEDTDNELELYKEELFKLQSAIEEQ